MELINGKFRLLKIISHSSIITTYLADDILKSEKVFLNIIKPEYLPENLKVYETYKNDYLNIESKYISKIKEMGAVRSIDNRRTSNTTYFFYTTEYINKIIDRLEEFDEELLIQLLYDICKGLGYIHLQGKIYKYLNPSNIIVYEDESGNIRAKLRDMFTATIKDNSIIPFDNNSIKYKSPEIINNLDISGSSDVYSLGMILKEYIIPRIKYGKDLNKTKTDSSTIKLTKIIRNMIHRDSKKRFEDVQKLVSALNKLFNKEEKFFDIQDIERLNLKHRLHGVDDYLNSIDKWCDEFNSGAGIAFIHGPNGTGKSSFLREFEWRVGISNENVYSSYSMEKNEELIYKPFKEIIKKSFNEIKREVINKYDKDINMVINGDQGNASFTGIDLSNPSERYKLNSKLLNFICEAVENQKHIILIDNLHNAKGSFLELLEMLLSKNTIDRNILLVVTYSDEEIWNNEKAHGFVNKFINRSNNFNLQLKQLDLDDSTALIKDILNMPYLPVKFARRIYNHTYGSPIFIQEVLKDLLAKKIIYIKKETGLWTCEMDDYEDIDLPENVVIASKGQLEKVDKECFRVLKLLAVIRGAVEKKLIVSCNLVQEDKLDRILERLFNKGIIKSDGYQFNDRYIFTNKMMKRVIYEKIEMKEKENLNLIIAELMEKRYLRGESINIKDMIEYFEVAKVFNKVSRYCIQLVDNLEVENDTAASIELLEKAIKYSQDGTEECIEFKIRLATFYNRQGNKQKMTNILEECLEECLESKFNKLAFDILYKLVGNQLISSEKEKNERYLDKMFQLYQKTGYVEGYLQYLVKKIRILALNENKFDEALILLDEAKSIEIGDNYVLKGELYNTDGIVNILVSNEINGMESLEKAEGYYEKAQNITGSIHVLNNMAVVKWDYFQDIKESLKYFEKSCRLAEENRLIEVLPLIYSNIAELNIDSNNLKKGLKYIKKCEELGNIFDYENILFLNTRKMTLYLEHGNFQELEKAYNKCNDILESGSEKGRTAGEFFIVSARRAIMYGDLEAATDFCAKAEEIFKHDNSKLFFKIKYLINVIKICKNEEIDSKDMRYIVDSVESITDKINYLFQFVVVCENYGNNSYDLIKKTFVGLENIERETLNFVTDYKLEIALSVLDPKRDNAKLMEMVEKIDSEKEPIFELYGNYVIAEKFYRSKNYIHSLNHYLKVIESYHKLYQGISENQREEFVNREVMNKISDRIYELEVYFTRNRQDVPRNTVLIDRIKELMTFDFYKNINNSKSFNQYTKKLYKHKELYYIEKLDDIIKNLYPEPEENIKFICNYLENISLADRCMILKYSNLDIETLYSSNGDISEPPKTIVDRVKITHEKIFFNRYEKGESELGLIMNNYTGIICIPIVEGRSSDVINIHNRRKSLNYRLTGMIYLESKNVMNNFNEKLLEKCYELIPLINSMISSYEFKMISAIDKLTNIYTRKYLMDFLKIELQKAYEIGNSLSILMVDLDYFKIINDKYGHQKGDEVLRRVCEISKKTLRSGDIMGRYGGEEFIIVLPQTGIEDALKIAERIRIKVKQSKILGENHNVTLSIGVSSYPEHSQLQEELIEKADKALYDAKEAGRDMVKKYTPMMEFQNKGANKLSGIITGNSVEDSRNVLTMIHILDLVEEKSCFRKKIYELLGRIVETTESKTVILFKVEKDKILNSYARERYSQKWVVEPNYNEELVREVIQMREGSCTIDWNMRTKNSVSSEMPEWNSIMCIPIENNEVIEWVIMLQVPTSEKEFNYENLNFVNVMVRIANIILRGGEDTISNPTT